MYHFRKVDSVLYQAAKMMSPLEEIVAKQPREYFADLCSEIIYQQLSDKAGNTIYNRFVALFPKKKVTATYLLQLPDEAIRNAGTSWAKVGFMKDLAQKTKNKEIAFAKLPEMQDEEVIEELRKIKGIGRWTAEMFLMFALARQDVFSFGDLGLKRGIEKLYNVSNPTRDELEEITIKWSPYRSYASRVLWRCLDNKVE